jgi:hypothetical protein
LADSRADRWSFAGYARWAEWDNRAVSAQLNPSTDTAYRESAQVGRKTIVSAQPTRELMWQFEAWNESVEWRMILGKGKVEIGNSGLIYFR